jgi:hypothetical protein
VAAGLVVAVARLDLVVARIAVGAAAVLLVAAGAPVADRYLDERYRPEAFAYRGAEAQAVERMFDWGRRQAGQRIGIDGGELHYPLFGPDLSNHVQYVGRGEPDGGFARIATCREWRTAINTGRYRYVITVPWGIESLSPPEPSPQGAWTASDPAVEVALRPGAGITIFRIDGSMHPEACASADQR